MSFGIMALPCNEQRTIPVAAVSTMLATITADPEA
jgi:hypothetical protein